MKWVNLTLATLTVIFFAACGGNERGVFVWPEGIDDERSPFYGETLTIGVFWEAGTMERLAGWYMSMNPGATIEIVDMNPEIRYRINPATDLENAREEINLRLMGGTAPLLIESLLVDYFNPATEPFFLDWLPVIEANPYFYKEYWFMHVFDAMSAGGSLMGFPMSFDLPNGPSYFTINNTAPGLTSEFSGRQSISVAEMMEIHARFSGDLPSLQFLSRDFDVLMAVENSLNKFLDIKTERVEFDTPEFIHFITHARDITNPDRSIGSAFEPTWHDITCRDCMSDHSRLYMFRRILSVSYESFGIFDDSLYFAYPLPFTSRQGELLITPSRTFVLTAGASPAEQALAFDFLRFILEIPNQDPEEYMLLHRWYSIIGGGTSSPHRSGLRFAFEFVPNAANLQFNLSNWRLTDGWGEVREVLIDHNYATMEMPMRDTRYPTVLRDVITGILHQFHDGQITAERAAFYLQNRVTLILMEMD